MKNAGVHVGLLLLLFSAFIFWKSLSISYTSSIGPGPGLFPRWLSGMLFICSIWLIVDSLRKGGISVKDLVPRGKALVRVVSIPAAIVLFIILAPVAGFTIACTIVLFIALVSEFKWYWSLGIAVFISISVFIAFSKLLKVPFPTNILGW